jgi:hypothetical protein
LSGEWGEPREREPAAARLERGGTSPAPPEALLEDPPSQHAEVINKSAARPLRPRKDMALTADEREIVSDLVHAVRTLAAQVMTLHLQLGAVRALLARKGTISDAEVQAAFAELNVVASAEELLSLTSTDATFDALLERLNRTA